MLKNIVPWGVAAMVALGLSAVAGTSYEAPAAPALSVAVPAEVCPPGFVGTWVDSTTTECLRELP